MKRQQAEDVLHRFFEESGKAVPAQSAIEPVLDRVWEQLEERSDEFVKARMPVELERPFRFAWAMGIVFAALLVNVVIWRQELPFSSAVNTRDAGADSLWKSSSQQAGDALQITAQDAFELASVKVLDPSSAAANSARQRDEFQSRLTGCSGGYAGETRVDPGRLTIPAVTVLTLAIVAYGHECSLVEGGPAWIRAGGEYYEVQGLLPPGTPSYTGQDLAKGNAPRLQRMLQNLLADRFRLVLRRELREMPVYTLTVATPGKMKLSPNETTQPPNFPLPPGFPPTPPVGRGQKFVLIRVQGGVNMFGHAIPMSELTKDLRQHAGRVVVDKTGFTGVFDYNLEFAAQAGPAAPSAIPTPPPSPEAVPPLPGVPSVPTAPQAPLPSLSDALAEQLGLKLEAARLPIEVLIIESVERPAQN